MIVELLRRGADDWVMAADLAWIAKSAGGAVTDEEILETALRIIRSVVDEGLMQLGDVTDDGFFEWDLTPEEAIERVEREWRALRRPPDLGDVCWLANTSVGDVRVQAAIEPRE